MPPIQVVLAAFSSPRHCRVGRLSWERTYSDAVRLSLIREPAFSAVVNASWWNLATHGIRT